MSDIDAKIAIEQTKQTLVLTKDKIIKFITATLKKTSQAIINLLINKIILYDDKIEIYYNYTDTQNPDDNTDRRDFLFYSETGSLPFSRFDNSGIEQRDVLVELYI